MIVAMGAARLHAGVLSALLQEPAVHWADSSQSATKHPSSCCNANDKRCAHLSSFHSIVVMF